MERLTISGGELKFYSEVVNKCSNRNLPEIKAQFDAGKKACEVEGYEYKEYSPDELKAIYARLAELEDMLDSGKVREVGEYYIVPSYRNNDDQRYQIMYVQEVEAESRYNYTLAEAEARLKELQESGE